MKEEKIILEKKDKIYKYNEIIHRKTCGTNFQLNKIIIGIHNKNLYNKILYYQLEQCNICNKIFVRKETICKSLINQKYIPIKLTPDIQQILNNPKVYHLKTDQKQEISPTYDINEKKEEGKK